MVGGSSRHRHDQDTAVRFFFLRNYRVATYARYGTVRCVFIFENRSAWCGAMRCGFFFFVLLPRIIRYGTMRCGSTSYGTMRCGSTSYGAVRCGAVRCGAVRSQPVKAGKNDVTPGRPARNNVLFEAIGPYLSASFVWRRTVRSGADYRRVSF